MACFIFRSHRKKLHFVKEHKVKYTNSDSDSMRPEGVEPPSQEPESCMISTTLRARITLNRLANFQNNYKGKSTEISTTVYSKPTAKAKAKSDAKVSIDTTIATVDSNIALFDRRTTRVY